MNGKEGLIINQAYEIIRKTYKEIGRLKDDVADLLDDYDSTIKFVEEYSYGPKTLYLKSNHTYLFKRKIEEDNSYEKILAVVCIFYDDGNFKRISYKDQPEIWFGLVDIKNKCDACRTWNICDMLCMDERKFFEKGELRTTGEVFNYYYIEENEEKDRDELGDH